MPYICTRGGETLTASQAILKGLAGNGGLYVPCSIPRAADDMLPFAPDLPYAQRAARVLSCFLDDFSAEEIGSICADSYGRFDDARIAPVRSPDESTAVLELFHGPTLAFKDMALQMLPRLTVFSAKKCGETRRVCILTATSGDTGKAALEGFEDVPGTRCTVFYPLDGVSRLQEKQMVTSGGNNTQVVAVRGNFDDAQTGVKRLFNDADFVRAMNERGCVLSSANSINIGRLVPQVAYYFSAYADLCAGGMLKKGEMFDACVPTGNFGDILAAYYARRMGVPIARLICASNRNDVLTEFMHTGVYNANRPFHKTISPSMDILISSNLERLLFELCGRDAKRVSAMMQSLKETGAFRLNADELAALQKDFAGVSADDNETRDEIALVWREKHYLLDPHTAVAMRALRKARAEEQAVRKTLVVSTASPFKFAQDVGEAVGLSRTEDALRDAETLSAFTGLPLPGPLARLRTAAVRHRAVCEPEQMGREVLNGLPE